MHKSYWSVLPPTRRLYAFIRVSFRITQKLFNCLEELHSVGLIIK